MRRKRRWRRRILLLILLLTAVILAVLVRGRMYPLVEELATVRVMNEANDLINDAIDEQIRQGAVDYNNMVLLEKDTNGNVTALKTNINEINRLKTTILDIVNAEIVKLDVEQIGVPIGNLLLPVFFSGRGFQLPVRILSVRSSDAGFENQFLQAGINQTLHQIIMTVEIQMTIVTPAGTELVETCSQVVVAETVIVGGVPDSYLTMETSLPEDQTKEAISYGPETGDLIPDPGA